MTKDDLTLILNLIQVNRNTMEFLEKFGFDGVDEAKLEQKRLAKRVQDELKELNAKEDSKAEENS